MCRVGSSGYGVRAIRLGEDRASYRPEAIEYAREEIKRRNLTIPENSDPGILRRGGENRTTSEIEKGVSFSGISILSKGLLVVLGCYTLYGRLADNKNGGKYSAAIGLALLSAMFWSFAWDSRVRSSPSAEGVPGEPEWPRGLVILAGASSVAAVILAYLELFYWR